jgi:solute carrier family 25 carnitine/acylcarnitine transporter 20/29
MFASIMREVPAYSAQFATYELLKAALTSSPSEVLSFHWGMVVGGLAGVNCWLFSYPQDIIKTHIQVSAKGEFKSHRYIWDGGFWNCGAKRYREKGVRGFFDGL